MAFDKNKTMQAAQKFIQKGQFEKATREYEKIARDDPRDIKVRQKLGDLYAREDKKEDALEQYNFAAKYYSDDGFHLKAIAVYKQIIKLDPSQIQINLKLADLYHKQNLIGDSIKQFQLVYSHYERKGDTLRVLDTLDKMAAMAPANLSLRMKLADAYYRNNLVERSLDEYIKIGDQLKKEDRTDDLIKIYEKLIKLNPQRIDMITELADIYLNNKNMSDKAEEKVNLGLKTEPANFKLLYFKSRILLLKEDYEKSRGILSKLIELDSTFIEAKEELAKVYEKLGDNDALKRTYTELMLFFRGNEEEKAGHYKALYESLQSTVSMDADEQEDVTEDADILELEEEDVLEADVLEELPGAEEYVGEMELSNEEGFIEVEEISPEEDLVERIEIADDLAGEPDEVDDIDSEGRLVMLKVDTYVKYGQYEEAVDVLAKYCNKKPESISAKSRLVELYLEMADKGEEPDKYRKVAAAQLVAISSLAKKRDNYVLSENSMNKAMELDPTVSPEDVPEEVVIGEIEEFDVVTEEEVEIGEMGQMGQMGQMEDDMVIQASEEIEIPDTIDIDDMGMEPIEISVDAGELSEGFEDAASMEKDDDSSKLISMVPEESLGEGEEYFDLRNELEGVLLDDDISIESKGGAGLLGEDDSISFEDVFDEFKKGIEKQFGSEDYDTYYNLGIAYREMGLYDDAISSFHVSVNAPTKRMDSFIMLGVTHRDISELEKSADYFREALDTQNIKPDERMGLNYELALSLELSGELGEAYSYYKKIYDEKPGFRDISEKIKSLKDRVGTPSGGDGVLEVQSTDEKPKSKPRGKISYV